jgi:hypothetical protein
MDNVSNIGFLSGFRLVIKKNNPGNELEKIGKILPE